MNKEQIWTKAFTSLFITNFTVFLVFYGLVTTLPLYAIGVLGRSDEEAGLLMTIFLLSAIIVRPFTGKILDIMEKRKVLWFGLLFYLACTILYYFVEPFSVLLILRFVQGIWFSIITTAAISIAADTVPLVRRGAGLGYFNMSQNLAVVLGPMIALYLIQSYSFDILFIVMSILMIIGVLTSVLVPTGNIIEKSTIRIKIKVSDLFEKRALPVSVLGSLVAFSYASVLTYLSIYAEQKGLLAFASSFFLIYAALMLLSRPLTGRLFDEKGSSYVLIPGMIFFIIGLFILAYTNSLWMFLVAGGAIGLGYGAIVPSLQTLAVQSTEHEKSGYATATFFTFFDLGIATGSYLLGLVAGNYGYQSVYFLSGVVIIIVLIFYIIFEQKRMKRN